MAAAKVEFLVTVIIEDGSINAYCQTEGQAEALANLLSFCPGIDRITVHESRNGLLGKLLSTRG